MVFDPSNLPYWILLGLGASLFLGIILMPGDDDDAAGLESLSWLGQVPLTLLLAIDLSLWGLFGWILNVWAPGWAVGIGSFLLALIGGRWVAQPIGRVLASFGEDPRSERLLGRVGTVSSARIPVAGKGRIGQVDVVDAAQNRVTISAVLPEWASVVPERGAEVIVIEQSRVGQIYVVICKEGPDQQRWLLPPTVTQGGPR